MQVFTHSLSLLLYVSRISLSFACVFSRTIFVCGYRLFTSEDLRENRKIWFKLNTLPPFTLKKSVILSLHQFTEISKLLFNWLSEVPMYLISTGMWQWATGRVQKSLLIADTVNQIEPWQVHDRDYHTDINAQFYPEYTKNTCVDGIQLYQDT